MSAGPAPIERLPAPLPRRISTPAARLAVLAIYAAAMGWLEAIVVLYIRGVLGFQHGALPPPPDRIGQELMRQPWVLPTEQIREAATIVMLATVAWLTGRTRRSRFGAFLVAFGVWDILYYVALYALVRWPPSLTTMDLLFLIPPSPLWNQPVWVPVVISLGMITIGTWMMGEPQRPVIASRPARVRDAG
jgi:hypothetical protein